MKKSVVFVVVVSCFNNYDYQGAIIIIPLSLGHPWWCAEEGATTGEPDVNIIYCSEKEDAAKQLDYFNDRS